MDKPKPLSTDEWTEREISAIYRENIGPSYNRIAVIKDRFMDAKIEASLKATPICSFKNNHGWCKLPEGHKGQHTVIYLGRDD